MGSSATAAHGLPRYLKERLHDEHHRADGAPGPAREEGYLQLSILAHEGASAAETPEGGMSAAVVSEAGWYRLARRAT